MPDNLRKCSLTAIIRLAIFVSSQSRLGYISCKRDQHYSRICDQDTLDSSSNAQPTSLADYADFEAK